MVETEIGRLGGQEELRFVTPCLRPQLPQRISTLATAKTNAEDSDTISPHAAVLTNSFYENALFLEAAFDRRDRYDRRRQVAARGRTSPRSQFQLAKRHTESRSRNYQRGFDADLQGNGRNYQ